MRHVWAREDDMFLRSFIHRLNHLERTRYNEKHE
jgi:hypothetical protein